jgi:alpha-1,3-glucosyltransferase
MTLFYAWLMGTLHHLPKNLFSKIIHLSSYAAILLLHSAEIVVGKVQRYPDLWVVGNVLVCFGCYGIAWTWLLKRLWIESLSGKPKVE